MLLTLVVEEHGLPFAVESTELLAGHWGQGDVEVLAVQLVWVVWVQMALGVRAPVGVGVVAPTEQKRWVRWSCPQTARIPRALGCIL